MVICELCGSANVETESACRVCGHALHAETVPSPVAAQTNTSTHPFEPSPPADITVNPHHLQMSAFGQDVSTGAPPMFGAATAQETVEAPGSERSGVPSFMQPGHRVPAAPVERMELISGSDLPDWIRQIAAADEAKAQAEADAQQAANLADAPASLIRRQLPGETVVARPSTTWLSKSSDTPEVSEHWGSAEVASANWGSQEPPSQPGVESYPASIPATAFVPTVREQPRRAKKGRFSSSGSPSGSSNTGPIYRNPIAQLSVALILLAIVAFMFV